MVRGAESGCEEPASVCTMTVWRTCSAPRAPRATSSLYVGVFPGCSACSPPHNVGPPKGFDPLPPTPHSVPHPFSVAVCARPNSHHSLLVLSAEPGRAGQCPKKNQLPAPGSAKDTFPVFCCATLVVTSLPVATAVTFGAGGFLLMPCAASNRSEMSWSAATFATPESTLTMNTVA